MGRPPSRLRVPGLAHRVEVSYDRHGMPHIRAQEQLDAYAAQGYVTAESRLFQLDVLRRTASGRLAELFGQRALAGDRLQRRLGLARLAHSKLGDLAPGARARLEAYASGVSAFIGGGRWPVEYAILGVAPEKWTLLDCLAVAELRAIVNSSWRADLVRAEVLARAGPERAAALFPDCALPDGEEFTRRLGLVDQGLLEPIRAAVHGSEDGLRLVGLHHAEMGTNAWAVDGRFTASGKPLLANDPHMGFVVPNLSYLVHLSAPGLEVRGLSFPGLPGVVVGHNDAIAWGNSALMADTQDVFIEELDEAGTHYRYRDEWLPCAQWREAIHIRGAATEYEEVRGTRHGPIVESRGRFGLALRWERLDQPAGDVSLHALNTATDWEAFRAALREYAGPAIDFVYADRRGNVGYQAAGRIPLRARGDGSLPVPGADGEHEWVGYLRFEDLPMDLNPASGVVVRANQNHLAKEYPHRLSARWHPAFRARRARDLLHAGRARHSPETLLAIQLDRTSLHSLFLRDRLRQGDAVSGAGMLVAEAWEVLEAWDGALLPESAGAAIIKEFDVVLRSALLGELLGQRLLLTYQTHWPASSEALEGILSAEDPSWLPRGVASYRALYRACFAEAVRRLDVSFGGRRASTWRWGALHPVHFTHPLQRLPVVGRRFRVPPVAVGSDGECIFSARSVGDYISTQQKAASESAGARGLSVNGAIFGTSARLVIDLACWGNSVLLLNLGQSGDPWSRHYRDHWKAWSAGRPIRPPYGWDAIGAACGRRLTLEPMVAP